MRTVTLALLTGVTLGMIATAQAADLDYGVLRGPDYEPAYTDIDWNGFYFGAHGGYSSTSHSYPDRFSSLAQNQATRPDTDSIFQNAWTSAASGLQTFNRRGDGNGFGGFAGYNYQFDEAVIGLEADYTSLNTSATSENLILTPFPPGNSVIKLSGQATSKIQDYGTVRVRAGYLLGDFMPFVTAGIAIGRAQISQQIVVSADDPRFNRTISDRTIGSPSSTAIDGSYSKIKVVGGLALGGGLEYALTQNILLRGEYQYVKFNDFDGYRININTVRGGAAVKF